MSESTGGLGTNADAAGPDNIPGGTMSPLRPTKASVSGAYAELDSHGTADADASVHDGELKEQSSLVAT